MLLTYTQAMIRFSNCGGLSRIYDSGKTFLDISLNTGQISVGLEAEKVTETCHPLYKTFV